VQRTRQHVSEGKKAHGMERTTPHRQRRGGVTDSLAEQRLEVEPPWLHRASCAEQARRQRHGGIGRGDTTRLLARGLLRRVERDEKGLVGHAASASRSADAGNVANLMTGSGMQQARKPQAVRHSRTESSDDARSAHDWSGSKPSRGCDTPRTERDEPTGKGSPKQRKLRELT
jgi:hypothetical protein